MATTADVIHHDLENKVTIESNQASWNCDTISMFACLRTNAKQMLEIVIVPKQGMNSIKLVVPLDFISWKKTPNDALRP